MIRRREFALGAALSPILASACSQQPLGLTPDSSVTETQYGETPDGPANLYTLTNAAGMHAAITNYGGIITALRTPDRNGAFASVVLGYPDLAGYVADTSFQGAIIGRYGNRIGGARFTLNGETYQLAANNGVNTLHGGARGFHKYLWAAETGTDESGAWLKLSRTSPDGEENYPGALNVDVTYTLTPANELKIDYSATTDKTTHVNLTNHAYFNLSGEGEPSILGHRLTIAADSITPVDAGLIPTGVLMPVEGTPFDFREAIEIGARINDRNQQLELGGGYDHNWVLNGGVTEAARHVARLDDPISGRIMEVSTTEPGLQFYSGYFLDGNMIGASAKPYPHRSALCLETQHYPDTPNKPSFPSTILNPGETYSSTTVYAFSAA
jgi:aldose 1-epimerase